MKTIIQIIFFIFFISILAKGKELNEVDILFPSKEEANKLLVQEDEYLKNLSKFDIDSRMQKNNSTKEEFKEYIKNETLEWNESEKQTIKSVIDELSNIINKNNYKLNFPDEVIFIKSTCKNEGYAMGYTRSNFIVLKNGIYSNNNQLVHLVLHELFHILSRSNPEFRKEIYKLIGFYLMPSINYPQEIFDYKISNPDATQTDSYIRLKVDGEEKECMMIMFSNREYKGGIFFEYFNLGFLALDGDKEKQIVYKDNNPVIYDFEEVEGFFEQIGMNTQYIINPEEIAAENFAIAILGKENLPNQDIIDNIKLLLKGD